MNPLLRVSPCLVAGTLAAQAAFLDDPTALPFQPGPPFPHALFHQLAVADFDRDGLADVMSDAGLLRNRGDGRFELVALPPGLCGAFAIGDLDGDGDVDCVFAQSTLNTFAEVFPCFNDGTGHFVAGPGLLPVVLTYVSGLAVGDVDGDGDLDILAGSRSRSAPGPMTLLLNQNGVFVAAPASLPATTEAGNFAIRLVDLDGDGDLDILRSDVGRCRLLVNNGAGVFSDQSLARLPATPAGMPLCCAVGDIDQDGDVDILLGGFALQVLQNNGGVFTDVTQTSTLTSAFPMTDVAIIDVDEDGLPDIVYAAFDPASSTGAGQSGGLINQGAGLFLPGVSLPPHLDVALSIAAADFDRDGDVDLVLGATYENSALVNARRQVLAAPLAPIGGSMVVDCFAWQYGSPFLALGASFTSPATPVAVPGLGLLALSPPIVTVRAQSLATMAWLRVQLPVPNRLQLIGTVLHLQGAVVAPGGGRGTGFTNHAVVVIGP